MPKILIIDDEPAIRQTLKEILEFEKYKIGEAADGEAGLQELITTRYDVVLCDIKMPKMDGIEVLEKAKELNLKGQFIMISAHGTIETAVEATKKGAFDFISKPPDLNRLLLAVRNALEYGKLEKETKVLRKKVGSTSEIIGNDPAIQAVKNTIDKVAGTDARVLVTGPNGSGKELVARWIHQKSQRADQALIEVNCAAIPSELIESELFGHEKGSFTNAHKQRIGKFEQADGSTLFLDEIGDMSLAAQAKVLRALQENEITRVGGDKNIKVDVRVLAATNKDLKQEIADGNFREDLYHRLSVIVIRVPSLADRKSDISLLAKAFLKEIATDYGQPKLTMEQEALDLLSNYSWPGNIRELRNVMERLVILSDKKITKKDVEDHL